MLNLYTYMFLKYIIEYIIFFSIDILKNYRFGTNKLFRVFIAQQKHFIYFFHRCKVLSYYRDPLLQGVIITRIFLISYQYNYQLFFLNTNFTGNKLYLILRIVFIN